MPKPLKFLVILISCWIISALCLIQTCAAEENPCLMCHAALKEAAKNVHPPFTMGCETCHKKVEGKSHPDQKGSIVLLQKMPGLCFTCHVEAKFKGSAVHSPVALGMCTGCHNPHNSKFGKLLKSDPPDLCYTCHDKAKFTKKYAHNVIKVVGCGSCHSPHVSDNPSLLPSPVNEICTTCHKAQGTGRHVVAIPGNRIHPVKGVKDTSTLKMIKTADPANPKRQIEVPDPKVPGKELTCASCHDPHSSDYPHLFPIQRICLKCHKY